MWKTFKSVIQENITHTVIEPDKETLISHVRETHEDEDWVFQESKNVSDSGSLVRSLEFSYKRMAEVNEIQELTESWKISGRGKWDKRNTQAGENLENCLYFITVYIILKCALKYAP